MLVFPTNGRLRQEDCCDCKASLGYIAKPYQIKQNLPLKAYTLRSETNHDSTVRVTPTAALHTALRAQAITVVAEPLLLEMLVLVDR